MYRNTSRMIRRTWRWIRMLSATGVPPPQLLAYLNKISYSNLHSISYSSKTSTIIRIGDGQRMVNQRLFSSQSLADAEIGRWTTIDIPLAQTGEGIAECEVLQWFIQEGEEVEEFQPLCQVQSDKATIDITSRYSGKVSEILHSPGDIVKVGETLVRMNIKESISQTEIQTCVDDGSFSGEFPSEKSGKILTTPAVRHLAKQYEIDLNLVKGSGKDGRVLKDDVIRYSNGKNVPRVLETGEQNQNVSAKDKTIPLRGFQRAMVKSMTMAARVPHFHYVEEMSCEALGKLKASFQEAISVHNIKCTFLPLLIKSLSVALGDFPWMNSCYHEETEAILKGSHNIGIAMATPNGLVVPNIKNVQSLSIFEIIQELLRLQILASNNKLTQQDVSDGTITLSNIGAIGGKFGTPLVNLPEAVIIALGRIQEVPTYDDNGNVFPKKVMNVCIGADHRIVDGATVARFCNEWKRLIENPELLMLNMR